MNEKKVSIFDISRKTNPYTTGYTNRAKITMFSCITVLATMIFGCIISIGYQCIEFGSYREAVEALNRYYDSIGYYEMTPTETIKTEFTETYDNWRTGIEMMFK